MKNHDELKSKKENYMFGLTKVSQIDRLASREVQLTERKRALAIAIGDAELQAGAAILESDAGPELATVIRLKAEREALELAINTVRNQRADAILAEFQSDAGKMRESVRAKQDELAAIESKTARLCEQLSGLERIQITADVYGMLAPYSNELRGEIARLQANAERTENSPVPDHGRIDLEDVVSNAEVVSAAATSELRTER